MSLAIPNPLLALHQQAEAELQPYGDLQIVSTFGEPQAEYAAIRKAAALMDLPHRGVLQLGGKDRLGFLNNLLTNEIWSKQSGRGLAAGQGIYAFLLNIKGRIVTDVNVLETGESTLLEMDARMIEAVGAILEKHLFSEQVTIGSMVGKLHQMAVHGAGGGAMLDPLIAPASVSSILQPLSSLQARLFGQSVTIYRDDPCGVPGYFLICPADAAANLWSEMVERFAQSDQLGKRLLRPMGWAVFNTTRIEAGRPIFGIDFDESVLPAETGQLERTVSFSKGCYLGQEIVARMHARGQVARQLVGIRVEDGALPAAGTAIYDQQRNQIGAVTSSTISPILSNTAIALGYVKKSFAGAGTQLLIAAEGAIRSARVTALPFIAAGGGSIAV